VHVQGANVSVNGKMLGQVNDQFLRYVYDLPAGLLQAADNTVTVSFDKGIGTDGRFMACTGGWDWVRWLLHPPVQRSGRWGIAP